MLEQLKVDVLVVNLVFFVYYLVMFIWGNVSVVDDMW